MALSVNAKAVRIGGPISSSSRGCLQLGRVAYRARPGWQGELLTRQKDNQCSSIDDRLGQKAGVVSIGASRHQVEVHSWIRARI